MIALEFVRLARRVAGAVCDQPYCDGFTSITCTH